MKFLTTAAFLAATFLGLSTTPTLALYDCTSCPPGWSCCSNFDEDDFGGGHALVTPERYYTPAGFFASWRRPTPSL